MKNTFPEMEKERLRSLKRIALKEDQEEARCHREMNYE
jgi:hypothetical protein